MEILAQGRVRQLRWYRHQICFIFLIVFFLFGCSAQSNKMSEPSQPASNTPKKTNAAALKQWNIQGQIAFIDKKNPKNSFSASANWAQRGSAYTIFVLGPINSANFRLTKTGGRVQLRFSDGKTFSAGSPETLLREQAHLNLPVSNLYYWIRGIPAPGAVGRTQLNSQGFLSELSQQGWIIQYLSYRKFGEFMLPDKLYVRYPSEQLEIKLAVYQW